MLAFLGLGSNLGDRRAHLEAAVDGLAELGDVEVSPLYETAPVGGPAGQGPYLNCVVKLTTELTPRELLEAAQGLERAAHRVRRERHGPRTLDVDILLLDDLVIDEEGLTVPHPRMHERAFVLAPLEDVAPERVPAGWRDRVGVGADLLHESVRRVGRLRDG